MMEFLSPYIPSSIESNPLSSFFYNKVYCTLLVDTLWLLLDMIVLAFNTSWISFMRGSLLIATHCSLDYCHSTVTERKAIPDKG